VSEPGDAPAQHVVQKPRRRTDQVTVADFTMLVRVDGKRECAAPPARAVCPQSV
jgi:hypothetical protein